MAQNGATIHASAILVGAKAALIRGPSGAGKSRLVLELLHAADMGLLSFARLVADDRAHIEAVHGRLLVRPAASLEGLLEIRGLGIRRLPFEPLAAAGMIVDLGAGDAERLPPEPALETVLEGVRLPRLGVAAGIDPLGPVLAFLRAAPAGN